MILQRFYSDNGLDDLVDHRSKFRRKMEDFDEKYGETLNTVGRAGLDLALTSASFGMGYKFKDRKKAHLIALSSSPYYIIKSKNKLDATIPIARNAVLVEAGRQVRIIRDKKKDKEDKNQKD